MLVLILMTRSARNEYGQRGVMVQRRRREMEQLVRKRAVILGRALQKKGVGREETADWLGVSAGSLRNWERQWNHDRLKLKPRGRPVEPLGATTRREVRDVLDALGPFTGLPTMRAMFAQIPRAEMEELIRRYRQEHVLRSQYLVHALRWTRPGVVWAMDFADPPLPVDGIFGRILSVRDLGSGKALLWLPMERKTRTEVRAALLALFLEHGAPLVLKSDNDSAFKPEEVASLLKTWGVTMLLSPCHYPRYNGSCESGIGTMKSYSHHEAARNDRPGEWSSDDLEAARMRANEHTRPRGHLGPTPEELWCSRDQILPDEREAFQERLQRNRNEASNLLCDAKGAELDRRDQAAVERDAITATLVESGMLQIRRRRISSPNKFRKLSRIMR